MIEKNHGHVVTMASGCGLFGLAGLVDYCASKHAVVGMEEALRAELRKSGKTGIKLTIICPYTISTGMFEGVKRRWSFLKKILLDYFDYLVYMPFLHLRMP